MSKGLIHIDNMATPTKNRMTTKKILDQANVKGFNTYRHHGHSCKKLCDYFICKSKLIYCFQFEGCPTPEIVGDGFCEDHVNNAECNFDGGDCCGSNVDFSFCQYCICYSTDCDASLQELIDDGYCNDETNNEECNFDGGDCCGSCANTDKCSNCICHASSTIDISCK